MFTYTFENTILTKTIKLDFYNFKNHKPTLKMKNDVKESLCDFRIINVSLYDVCVSVGLMDSVFFKHNLT